MIRKDRFFQKNEVPHSPSTPVLQHSRSSGILLIEIMIAIGIIAIGLTVIMRSFTLSLHAYQSSEKRNLAMSLLEDMSTDILSREKLNAGHSGRTAPPFEGYAWSHSIEEAMSWSPPSEEEKDTAESEAPSYEDLLRLSLGGEMQTVEEESGPRFVLYRITSRIEWQERGRTVSIETVAYTERFIDETPLITGIGEN